MRAVPRRGIAFGYSVLIRNKPSQAVKARILRISMEPEIRGIVVFNHFICNLEFLDPVVS